MGHFQVSRFVIDFGFRVSDFGFPPKECIVAVLTRPTLVLNRNWQPVGVAPVARTLVLLWTESARVVDPRDYQLYTWADWSALRPGDDEPFIQAVRFRLRVPEVVVLTHYDRVPGNSVPFSRRNIYKRDRFTCQYCGAQPGTNELTVDHVIPRSQGGTTSWENCVLACVTCNSRKADRTPAQAHMPLRHPPTKPYWRPMYAAHAVRIESWSRFVSEAYWNVELGE
jgi:5-methylcytosine-specific restriction endonuclease McrA